MPDIDVDVLIFTCFLEDDLPAGLDAEACRAAVLGAFADLGTQAAAVVNLHGVCRCTSWPGQGAWVCVDVCVCGGGGVGGGCTAMPLLVHGQVLPYVCVAGAAVVGTPLLLMWLPVCWRHAFDPEAHIRTPLTCARHIGGAAGRGTEAQGLERACRPWPGMQQGR